MDVRKVDKTVTEYLLEAVTNLDLEVRSNGRIRVTLSLDLTSGLGIATY
jgi:hypothetical protein